MSDRGKQIEALGAHCTGIPAISLWQPWATLIALGAKSIETRSWNLKYRGVLAIHAAQHRGALGMAYTVDPIRRALKANNLDPRRLPLGKILCLVEVQRVEVITAELRDRTTSREQLFGNFADGRYAWYLARVRPLDNPLPATGHQGLWRWECPTALLNTFTSPTPSAPSSN